MVALVVTWMPVQVQAQVDRDVGRVAPAPALADFWRAVEDPVLDRLIATALDANRDVHAAEARALAARASRTSAALDFAPAVTAVGGYSRQRFSSAALPGASGRLPDQDVWDAGLQLSWELDVFGRVRRTVQAENALLASAEEDALDARVVVIAEVARAYFELRGVQDRLEVARRNADNQRRTLELVRDRLDAGRGTALDTERAQAQLSSTLADIPMLEAAASAWTSRIGTLLGRPPGALPRELLEPAGSAFALPEVPAAGDADRLAGRRPDVRSAEERLAAQRALTGAARSAYLPRLSIGGTAGYTANAFDALGGNGTPRYTIGPVLSWPLFDLGRVKAGVAAAHARETEAAARYEQTLLRAREEVETAFTGYEQARSRLQHLEEAAAASERATELARLRFENGAVDFLEVLDAERRLLEASDRFVAGRIEAAVRLAALFRATAN